MASATLIANSGSFTIEPLGVEMFEGEILFELTGEAALLYESPLYKLRGEDINFLIEKTIIPETIKTPKFTPQDDIYYGGGGLIYKKKKPIVVYEEEDELITICTMFLDYANNRLF